MKVQIKLKFTEKILFEGEYDSQKIAVEEAVKKGASLEGANLKGASLEGAYLYGAYLEGANLEGANLYGANLEGANLEGANLYGANLYGANLKGAKNSELVCALVTILPEGDLIGWKKCRDGEIAKLLIPANAKRSNATGRKCRAEFVEVLEMFGGEEGHSTSYAPSSEILTYKKGEIVKCVKPFDEDRFEECSSGIHFYITRIEAENN